MAKTSKWNLNTIVQSLTGSTGGTGLGLGGVPQGKKRFVTYLKIQCRGPANIVNIGESTSTTSVGALSTTFFSEYVNDTFQYPERPGDVDHPLFAIDSPAHLNVVTGISNVSGTILTLQYYDAP